MSEHDPTRRELLRGAALSAVLGGLNAEAAQHVHAVAAQQKKAAGVYRPQAFTAHEFRTLGVLCELILPGAREAGAAEFIDLLAGHNAELKAIFTGGLAWLDRRASKPFADAAPAERTALLDRIAYRKNDSPELGPGIHFFDWARKMVVDAYFTSPAGIAALGYKGNVGMTRFQVPKEALDYALRRAPE